ncbi:TPA: DNA methylase [Vibrio parahaemolyticus]|nr:DNA methylase [Vibrio parahaemolyticus]
MKQENLFGTENEKKDSGPVECLGMTFESDEARRAHFIELLREKLKDPEFRAIEGFPIGSDEAILELSDPPYYTACPNPFLDDVVHLAGAKQVENKIVTTPSSDDIKVGKNDPAYNAHSYHTKVPHQAIVKTIIHYTNAGDLVLDAFSGSGMTALAASKCGDLESLTEMGYEIKDNEIFDQGVSISQFGQRTCIASDLSPFASFISYNYTNEFDKADFQKHSSILLESLKEKYGHLYTTDIASSTTTDISFVIWSEVHTCGACGHGNTYWSLVTDENSEYDGNATCEKCGSKYTSRNPNREFESYYDHVLGTTMDTVRYIPVKICYNQSNRRHFKQPDGSDHQKIKDGSDITATRWLSTHKLIEGDRWRRDALGLKKLTYTHQFFTNRNYAFLSDMMSIIDDFTCSHRTKSILRSLCTSCISRLHKLNRYIPKHNRHVGPMSGTLYVSPLWVEISPIYFLEEKIKAHLKINLSESKSYISSNSATKLMIEDDSIDYIFTDPPFGENLQYSELNSIYESFLNIRTNSEKEAVINAPQEKNVDEYRDLMSQSFLEYYRVLKSGKWITVEFSNSKNSIWIAIQEAMSKAGFVVSDVSVLDKKKGTTKQLSLQNAVKQDLIISAYKPSLELLSKFDHEASPESCCWYFVSEHLNKLPVCQLNDGLIEKVSERSKYAIFDRMVSYFVRSNMMVPIDASDFYSELLDRYYEEDDMIFTALQIQQYRKEKGKYHLNENLDILISNEKSSIEWLRNLLRKKPQAYSEIHPEFLQLSKWSKQEKELELKELLELNFLCYDGKDDVPSQIHTYLSTNFKDMRGLDKSDPKLVAKAKDRWYVPDPNKAADLEKVRLRALLKEFETYKEAKKKIKQPRAEALRAGFNTAWEAQNFQTILDISAKIPPAVLQEDEKLLMFYDNALTLTSTEDDEW